MQQTVVQLSNTVTLTVMVRWSGHCYGHSTIGS